LQGAYPANAWIRLYPNFSDSPQHSPLVRLLLSSFWISNGPPQKVVLMWPISPLLQSVSLQHPLL
ncbi:50S ribosomal protein l2 chloroplastic, partial [Phtheirospermum japonicum]